MPSEITLRQFLFWTNQFLIITGCCKYLANIVQIFPTLQKKIPGPTMNKKIRLYGTLESMPLKIIKMRGVLFKIDKRSYSRSRTINLADLQNKFDQNIFSDQRCYLRKIKQVEDLSSEILFFFIEDDDFIGEDAFTAKFSIFTYYNIFDFHIRQNFRFLLDNHRYV